jgi:hypothetical protein
MKTFNTAKIGDIAERFSSKAMLTAMATLCICFFLAYMSAALWFYTILVITAFFTCTHAHKRIVNRIIHHRKFALFPGYAEQCCQREVQTCSRGEFLRMPDPKRRQSKSMNNTILWLWTVLPLKSKDLNFQISERNS